MTDGAFVLLALLANVLFGAAGAWLAGRRNRNRGAWFAACFFFTWIALVILALLPKVLVAQGRLLSPRQQAEIAADPAQLDDFGRNFDSMFRTARGPVIRINDGNALAQVGDEFWLFPSLAIYRQVYQDNSSWDEITNPDERRRFLTLASRYLPQPAAK